MEIYNIEDKFLYEILDDYKTLDNKKEIFEEFIKVIFKCNNVRQTTVKNIKYKVLDDKLSSEIGQVFVKYQCVPFYYSKTKTNNTDFVNLVRQKINNIYNNYCEEKICTRKEYMELLKYPKQLYHQWINGEDFNLTVDELDKVINDKLKLAEDIKLKYSKQKMKLRWKDYKSFVYECLEKAFNNFICLDDFEDKQNFVLNIDTWNEDNFCVRYLCRCLDGGIRDFQKEYYGLYRKGKRSKLIYARCEDCGKMFWSNRNATKTYRCQECQKLTNYEPNPIVKVKCIDCGKVFNTTSLASKTYRCNDCQKLADYSPILTKTITCIDCGKPVEVDAKNTKTCRCDECQVIENRRVKREYWRKKYGKLTN